MKTFDNAIFNCVKRGKMYYYYWINIPQRLKEVLSPNQCTLRSKTELTRKQLVDATGDLYNVFLEEIKSLN